MFQSNLYNKIHIPNYQRKKSKSPHYNKQIFQKYFQIEPSINSVNINNYIHDENLNVLNDQIKFENLKFNFQILSQKINRLNNIISNTDYINSKRIYLNKNYSNYFNKSYNYKNNPPFEQKNCYYNLNYNNNIYNNNFNNNHQFKSNNYQITKESENLSEIADNIIETFNLEKNNNSEQDSNRDNSILISQEILVNDPCWIDENSNKNINNNNNFQVGNYNKNFNNNQESNIIEIQIKNNKIEEKVYTENEMNYFNLMKKQLKYKIYRNMEYSYYAKNENDCNNKIEQRNIKQKENNKKNNNKINNENIKKNKNENLNNKDNKEIEKLDQNNKIEQESLNKNKKKDKEEQKEETEIKENKGNENVLNHSNSLNTDEEEDLILSSIIAKANSSEINEKQITLNKNPIIPKLIIPNKDENKLNKNEIDSNKKKKNVAFNDSSCVKILFSENDKVNHLYSYDNNNNNKLQFNQSNINNSNEKPKSIIQSGSNCNYFNSGSSSTLITPRDNNNSNIISNNSNKSLHIQNLKLKRNKINDERNDNKLKKNQIINNIKNNKKDKVINKNIMEINIKNNSKEKKNKIEGIIKTKDISQKLKNGIVNTSKDKNKNTNRNKIINSNQIINKSNSKEKK